MIDEWPNDSLPILVVLAELVTTMERAGAGDYAAAMRELGVLAVTHVPPNDWRSCTSGARPTDPYPRIKDVAVRHLGLGELEHNLRIVMSNGVLEEHRNAVDAAMERFLEVRDTALILWGICAGLVFAGHASSGR